MDLTPLVDAARTRLILSRKIGLFMDSQFQFIQAGRCRCSSKSCGTNFWTSGSLWTQFTWMVLDWLQCVSPNFWFVNRFHELLHCELSIVWTTAPIISFENASGSEVRYSDSSQVEATIIYFSELHIAEWFWSEDHVHDISIINSLLERGDSSPVQLKPDIQMSHVCPERC